jgi:HEAT repeat protein
MPEFSPESPRAFAELLESMKSISGYVRERAVRMLAGHEDIRALPALIERANDWVPQVRDAAAGAIGRLLVSANAAAFVDALPAIMALRKGRRADHSALIGAVERFLLDRCSADAVMAGLRGARTDIAWFCVPVAAGNPGLDLSTVVRAVLACPDARVRARAVSLLERLDIATRAELVTLALRDPCPPLRRAALRLRLGENGDAEIDAALLFDRHASVRRLVAERLQRRGVDVPAAYRQAAGTEASPHRRAIAIAALGDCGKADDVPLLSAALNDALPSLRRSALAAYVRVSGARARDVLVAALGDPSPAVAKTAAQLCRRLALPPTVRELMPLIEKKQMDERRIRQFVSASFHADKWERLTLLLAVRRQPVIAEKLSRTLENEWQMRFNRSFSVASADQRERLRDELARAPRDEHLNTRAWQGILELLRDEGIAD